MIASAHQGGDDYVIEHKGRVIGKAGCYRLPEIGYMLHPDVWGMGFAERRCRRSFLGCSPAGTAIEADGGCRS